MGVNDHCPTDEDYIAIAIQAGAVQYCPRHSGVFIRLFDDDAENRAYAIATNKWKRKELFGDREEIMDGIKLVFDSAADECPECRRIFDE